MLLFSEVDPQKYQMIGTAFTGREGWTGILALGGLDLYRTSIYGVGVNAGGALAGRA
ncbi:hypothetical protein GOL95_29455 [Sinorhizobium medicae]|nr:hypothetical protein [Sinorhizobium medicae]MDX0839922.1 hypothetical protein [Sinorhizobium medicae]MDX1107915.1 hypothetical protein [Sinorhizobium medicae]MDX1120681.1 hypothetical protein [Sinorhizobium medicae]MDX1244067.1 hypothetical protein [Sinorhizobium medicae]